MANVQTILADVTTLEFLTKEIDEQSQKRMTLLETYTKLFKGAVDGNVNGDVFETLVMDLKEQSENITGIVVDNTDYVMCELELVSKFDLLFNQREVSEIRKTMQSICESMRNLATVSKSLIESEISNILNENSIDEAEFYKLFESEYLN